MSTDLTIAKREVSGTIHGDFKPTVGETGAVLYML
jgi:hypothetical protein